VRYQNRILVCLVGMIEILCNAFDAHLNFFLHHQSLVMCDGSCLFLCEVDEVAAMELDQVFGNFVVLRYPRMSRRVDCSWGHFSERVQMLMAKFTCASPNVTQMNRLVITPIMFSEFFLLGSVLELHTLWWSM
jgi:hypothetical protein